MKSDKNLIDKFFLDFTFKVSKAGNSQLTEHTRTIFYNNLLPKIDSLLSKYGDNTHIRIDSLTIDLENISPNDLPDKLLAELESELDKYMQNSFPTRPTTGNADAKAPSEIDALIYFLQTGSLPWYHDSDLHPDKLLTGILKNEKQHVIDGLRQLFKTNDTALGRFILQFTNKQVAEVFTSLTTGSSFEPTLIAWYELVAKHPEHVAKVFQFVIEHEVFKNKTLPLDVLAKEVILPYLNADLSILPQISAELQADIENSVVQTNTLTTLFKTLEKKYRSKRIAAASADQPAQTLTDPPSVKGQDIIPHSKTVEADINSYAINNAGLVILFPYLQMFFNEIGLVKDETFVTRASSLKAVQVLQYLATGSLKTPEHLLALNKVMCGVDIAMPSPARLRLTKEQKEACDILLNSVIANWPTLKNTSIDGFRQSFLQRNGTLKKDDDDWILYVEKKGLDILLEELPWGFSVVKFPWNEYFVHTQW